MEQSFPVLIFLEFPGSLVAQRVTALVFRAISLALAKEQGVATPPTPLLDPPLLAVANPCGPTKTKGDTQGCRKKNFIGQAIEATP